MLEHTYLNPSYCVGKLPPKWRRGEWLDENIFFERQRGTNYLLVSENETDSGIQVELLNEDQEVVSRVQLLAEDNDWSDMEAATEQALAVARGMMAAARSIEATL